MAQDGDTITYTHDGDADDNGDLIPEQEDVSAVDTAIVDYCDGAGGGSGESTGGSGGRVENAEIDVSTQDTLYIWVADGFGEGRYRGEFAFAGAGGSTEISFSNTNQADSADEPFLVGAGGGGGGYDTISTPFDTFSGSDGAARDGASGTGEGDADGTGAPLGGDGAPDNSTPAEDGDGAIDDQNRGFVTGGTITKGGGSGPETDAEVQITYKSDLSPPDAPSNLTAEVQ